MEHSSQKFRCIFFFQYYELGKEPQLDEKEEGGVDGGNVLPSNIAMLRIKLGLSDTEIMDRPWILTQIESCDFPQWNSKKKKIITDPKEASSILNKYKK